MANVSSVPPPGIAFASQSGPRGEDAYGSQILKNGFQYAAVYDGHRGKLASFLCSRRIPELLDVCYAQGSTTIDALRTAFLTAHSEITGDSGTTASVVLISRSYVALAYVGDSRVILCRGGKETDLTVDHRTSNLRELKRVNLARRQLACSQPAQTIKPQLQGARIDGLMLTRSLGDHGLSRYISPNPVVVELLRGSGPEFIVLATDGLRDVCSSVEACALITVQGAESAAEAAQCLVHHASMQYRSLGVRADDITCGVVCTAGNDAGPEASCGDNRSNCKAQFWSFETQMKADLSTLSAAPGSGRSITGRVRPN